MKTDGTYLVADLLSGIYEITASAQGFEDTPAIVAISAHGKPVVNLVMQAASTARADRGQASCSTVKGGVTTIEAGECAGTGVVVENAIARRCLDFSAWPDRLMRVM